MDVAIPVWCEGREVIDDSNTAPVNRNEAIPEQISDLVLVTSIMASIP